MKIISDCPNIRIDDFPSGVRPIPKDKSRMQSLLNEIDSLGIPYTLGIVPAICDEQDWKFLNSLLNMVPAMHGIVHNYYQFSEVCRQNNDEKNSFSVLRQFNELKTLPLKMRLPVLTAFRNLMSNKLHRQVKIYIPPCNKVTMLDSKFLKQAGFEAMYCQKRKFFSFLPIIRSQFYGVSNEATTKLKSVALHITWELDLESNSSVLELISSMKRA